MRANSDRKIGGNFYYRRNKIPAHLQRFITDQKTKIKTEQKTNPNPR